MFISAVAWRRGFKIFHIDQYIKPNTSTDLGLIRDAVNPMTKQAKQVAKILAKILKNKDLNSKVAGLKQKNEHRR